MKDKRIAALVASAVLMACIVCAAVLSRKPDGVQPPASGAEAFPAPEEMRENAGTGQPDRSGRSVMEAELPEMKIPDSDLKEEENASVGLSGGGSGNAPRGGSVSAGSAAGGSPGGLSEGKSAGPAAGSGEETQYNGGVEPAGISGDTEEGADRYSGIGNPFGTESEGDGAGGIHVNGNGDILLPEVP